MAQDCCKPIYDGFFDQKVADKQLRRYLKKGVKRNTRPLVNALKKLPLQDRSLLDIGGGVGEIPFELDKKGIDQISHVDLSTAYSNAFFSEVKKRDMTDRVKRYQGDFVDLHDQLEPADVVTLDKVICCYEDYKHLVDYSSAKAQKWYAYTVPRDVWWVKAVQQLGVLIQKIRRDPFRPYVHSTQKIEERLQRAGFKKIHQSYQLQWMTSVFERKTI